MAGKTSTPAKKAAAAPTKRKMLTPAERVAKMEAELATARKNAEAAIAKQGKRLVEARDKLVAKRDELQSRINKVQAELDASGYTANLEAVASGGDSTGTPS